MKLKKNYLLRIFILIVSTLVIGVILTEKLNLNYETSILKSRIKLTKESEKGINLEKLKLMPYFSVLAKFYSMDSISNRLNEKINSNEICSRSKDAIKRNVSIQVTPQSIAMEILFVEEANLIKCQLELDNYIELQKKGFIKEAANLMENYNKTNEQKFLVIINPLGGDKKYQEYERVTENLNPDYLEEYLSNAYNQLKQPNLFFLTHKIERKKINKYLILGLTYFLLLFFITLILFKDEVVVIFSKFKLNS